MTRHQEPAWALAGGPRNHVDTSIVIGWTRCQSFVDAWVREFDSRGVPFTRSTEAAA